MSPTLQKILNALEKADSIPAKEKERLRKELEKTEKTLGEKDTLLSSQARELEIETALERIRARAMAMQSSEELHDVLCVLFQQFDVLGIKPISAFLSLFSSEERTLTYRATGTSGARTQGSQTVEIDSLEVWKEVYDKWKTDTSEAVEVIHYPTEILPKLFDLFEETFSAMPADERMSPEHFPEGGYTMHGHTRFGYIGYNHTRLPTEEEKEILTKFATEFERVYQRFLDIENAEAQARQAQIEAALERVRTRTMAMHNTEDIAATVTTFFNEIRGLGLGNTTRSGIGILSQSEKMELWTASVKDKSDVVLHEGLLDMTIHPLLEGVKRAWKAGDPLFTYELKGEDKLVYFRAINKAPEYPIKIDLKKLPKKVYHYSFPFRDGSLFVFSDEYLQDDIQDIFKRFAAVFGQTYTRYLDLHKAEAQAREAKIEAALERIRARSMAMHSSEELNDVLRILFQQIEVLGIDAKCAHLTLMDLENNTFSFRITGKNGAANIGEQIIDLNAMPIWKETVAKWKKAKPHSHQCLVYPKEILPDLWKLIDTSLKSLPAKERIKISDFPNGLFDCEGHTKFGYIGFNNSRPPTDEEISIAIRFAREFERVYQRFLEIKKAEAQVREAKIEAAIEKVRSQSLAMHNTSEMQQVANAVFDQLQNLGLEMDAVGMSGVIEAKQDYDVWVGGAPFGKALRIPYNEDTKVQRDYNKAINLRHELFAKTYSGKVKEEYINHLLTHGEFPKALKKKMVTSNAFSTSIAFAKNSGIQIAQYTSKPYTTEENELLKRFARVFEQAYIRFMDLQKAEVQAREAQIEAALERVRAASMAMHQTDDIGDVVVVFFDQLKQLNIPFEQAWINIFHLEEGYLDTWFSPLDGIYPEPTYFKLPSGPWEETAIKSWKSGAPFAYMSLETKVEVDQFLEACDEITDSKYFTHLQKKRRYDRLEFLETRHKYGFISKTSKEKPTKEDEDILQRFAKVFEQTYTRFLDIEKAEEQAREAQIEAAIEKVRSQSLAMHTTSEMQQVANAVFDQLQNLGLEMDTVGMSGVIEAKQDYDVWVGGAPFGKALRIPYNEKSKVQRDYNKMLKDRPELFARTYSGKVKKEYIDRLLTHGEFPPALRKKMETSDAFTTLIAPKKNSGIQVVRYTDQPFTEQDAEILKRFAGVFEQAYIRFMDLEKAEAQAREAQIEVAMERVRSRAMAMHHTDELTDVLGVLFDQFDFLGINPVLTHLTLFDEENETFTLRITRGGKNRVIAEQRIDVNAVDSWKTSFANWKKSELHAVDCIDYPPEVLPAVWEVLDGVMSALPEGQKIFPEDFPNGLYTTQGHCKYGYIGFNHSRRATEEEKEIVIRFAKEFGRLYQRFLDIQKAESQAREAQIEGALERVRSKAMAMHSSDDLADTVEILYKELDTLQVHALRFGHAKVNSDTKIVELHTATDLGKVVGQLNLEGHPLLEKIYEHYLAKEDLYYALQGEEMKSYYSILGRAIDVPIPPMDTVQHGYFFFLGDTANYAWSDNALDEEELKVYRRLITVLNLTYKRYEELKNAETQAREAQIEGALERVRSKTMAMHNSEDLEEIVLSLFDEVLKLGIDKSMRCGIGILEGHEGMETRSVNSNSDGTVDLKVGMLNMTIHPMLVGVKKAWKNGSKSYSYEYSSKDVKKYYTALNNEPEYPFNADLTSLPNQEYHRSFFFSSGIIFAFSENPISEESSKILARFAAVFGQTYQRFLDLQKAEERAKDAIKQASLDRVRGQIASMRSVNDLERITPLVWNELTILGIPFIRCGVFIIEESSKMVQAFLSAPDGRSLGAMKIPFDAEKNTAETVAHWQKGEVYRTHWDKKQFLQFMQNMIDLGQVNNNKKYQGAEEPPESLHLHFVPFTQGMLYVGSEATLTEEQIELVQSLADAFAIAYARYEDFSKLEKAKERVETTLSELKATQNQLVQSEKMASLGELTAGIAHEIQNPLNFVNNFSEVSIELITEMLEEIQKGDVEEVKALAEDIIQNLEKINHHGKRADGIVKGMLQHSRASSGEKEPTDINTLADEYLRLAYHGLRAKDKSFNAKLETHFEEGVGKVKVLPQDMGRVILNLITNAFYVVTEKKNAPLLPAPKGVVTYEPTVWVSTKRLGTPLGAGGGKVEISVRDNGNGIPDAIKEKIFQPFFTTKPTGQGTGLGLSMSYDIVTKGHGGELKVDTKLGEGTTFTITIPDKQAL